MDNELKDNALRSSGELPNKIRLLQGAFNVILIDCPPSLKSLTSNALAAATHLIIPIESGCMV
ncbi:MAG: AAA family ATPase [Methylococcales bacterium]